MNIWAQNSENFNGKILNDYIHSSSSKNCLKLIKLCIQYEKNEYWMNRCLKEIIFYHMSSYGMFVLALRTNLRTILRTILHAIIRTILRAILRTILHAKLVPTFSTRVDLHAWQTPRVLMLHVEIYTRVDLHACKFPHVNTRGACHACKSTRVEKVGTSLARRIARRIRAHC